MAMIGSRLSQSRSGGLFQFIDSLCDVFLQARFDADEEFLQAFRGLGYGLEPAGLATLHLDGPSAASSAQGLASVGASDNHAYNPLERFDFFDGSVAFLGCALVSTAGWHFSGGIGDGLRIVQRQFSRIMPVFRKGPNV